MALELTEVKNFLRIDFDDDDALLEHYIQTAEEYVKSACGENVNLEKSKAKTIMLMLIGDYYESHSPYGQQKYSQNISTLLLQLQLETDIEADNVTDVDGDTDKEETE